MEAPPTQAAGTGTAGNAAAAAGAGNLLTASGTGDVTNNNLRSSGISTAAISDGTNAAAAIMFESKLSNP